MTTTYLNRKPSRWADAPPTYPTLSRWSNAQRYALRAASEATISERQRSNADPATMVLLYVLAKTAPVSLRPGELSSHTGLTAQEVANTVADLEDSGLLEPGSASTGRIGFLMPAVLAALGLNGYGIDSDRVRANVHPSGCAVEGTDDNLTEAFGTMATA